MEIVSENCKCCKENARELHKTYLLLIAERQKNELYRQLIEQRYNLTIPPHEVSIDDLITYVNGKFFDNIVQPLQITQPQQPSQQPKHHKKVFRAIPKAINDEPVNRENIKEIEERVLQENVKVFGEYDIDLNNDTMTNKITQLSTVKSTKECTSILQDMKSQRQLQMLTLSPSEYGSYLVEHLDQIRKILGENEHIGNKLDAKKFSSLISRILTTLEQRIVFHPGFQSQTTDVDEITKYRQCLVLSAKHPKTYRTFDSQKFYDYFTNFSLAFFPLSEMFEIYVSNPYGYYNLCFSNFGNDNEYAFYFLEKYDGNVRYWTMDCRLEALCLKLAEITRSYCISLFRKIYKLCFGSNDYIENYKTRYSVLEFDCEQLLRNILFTLNVNVFTHSISSIVKKCCTVTPTSSDKFSSCSDNEEQAISFKRYELLDSDVIAVIETIFDNIKESQCLDIYKNYTTK